MTLIDGLLVNGSARVVGWFAERDAAMLQSGYIYPYAFTMIIGVFSCSRSGSTGPEAARRTPDP